MFNNNALQAQENELNNNQTLELIQTIKNENICRAIDFNFDSSLIALACDNKIKICRFNQSIILNDSLLLEGHIELVNILILSRTQNFLISSAGKVIKIWKQINENQWEMFSCQKNHFHQITCMVFNQEEDQLISSSIDCTINIWQVNKELNVISYSQTLTNHNDYVYSVNLSPSGALFASCDKSGGIIVWELNNNKMWELKQLISTQKGDFRFHVKFINENKLIYQQYKVGIITQLNRIDNKFQISQQKIMFSDQSDSDCMFSIILLVKKKLLIFRHFSSIYIFKLENDQDHQKLIQKLNCTHSSIYGQISKNEKYLAYWDYGLKEILLYKIL